MMLLTGNLRKYLVDPGGNPACRVYRDPQLGTMAGMSAPWLESKTPVGPPTAANPTVRQLIYAGVVTGSWSGILSLVVYLVGRLFGVPFNVTNSLGEGPSSVTWLFVLLVPLVAAVVGALLASLARGLVHAGRLVFWVGTLVALASCLIPLLQPAGVGWATRVLIIVMHVITWFLVVPQIARIVGDSEPGAHVDRSE
jgi:hypothetical protein